MAKSVTAEEEPRCSAVKAGSFDADFEPVPLQSSNFKKKTRFQFETNKQTTTKSSVRHKTLVKSPELFDARSEARRCDWDVGLYGPM